MSTTTVPIPLIKEVMTQSPLSISSESNLLSALQVFREKKIRHLPVQKDGKLVGVLTDGEVKIACSLENSGELSVENVMSPDPYCVSPETPIDEVAGKMAKHKYGCALVVDQTGKPIGIFTDIDGLRLLAKYLQAAAGQQTTKG